MPRKVALVAWLAALLAVMVGAGFANMSASGAPTALETSVVRWIALGCIAVGLAAYLIGGRMLRDDAS